MDDALKAAGVVTGGGLGIGAVMLAKRVYDDDALTWFVVGGLMLIALVVAIIIALAMWRAAMESRADVLTRSAERSLIAARGVRTLDGVSNGHTGGDILGQIIAGQNGGDVVGNAQPGGLVWQAAPTEEDGDG